MLSLILTASLHGLGRAGDEVNLRPGYARNFLLAKKRAIRTTIENRHNMKLMHELLISNEGRRVQEAKELAEQFLDMEIVVIRSAGSAGNLYGSVTPKDIAEAVSFRGLRISRSNVVLTQPIKKLGARTVEILLHPEIYGRIVVKVARTAEEASNQSMAETNM